MAKKKKAVTIKKTSKRKGGGSKLARTEIVQVRLDPKLKFAAELAARRQRRTLSSFIEWAVEEAVKKVPIECHYGDSDNDFEQWNEYAIDAIKKAWDVDEADRFAKMAHHYPQLLTHEEEVLWKVVLTCHEFWKGSSNNLKNLNMEYFRKCFPYVKMYSKGEISEGVMTEKLIFPDGHPFLEKL